MSPHGEDGPRFIAWWIAAISLVLPVIGVVLAIIGASQMLHGGDLGWLLYAGIACIALDLAIDLWWAHPSVSKSDQPDLNVRGRELVGRVVVVAEPIENGRGKVRAGDTLWPAEGPDAAFGAQVVVTGVKGTVLVVA